MSNENITAQKIFDGVTIAASGSSTCDEINLTWGVLGYASLQYEVSGDGTCKFEAEMTVNETDFLIPSALTGNEIATGITKTSGPGSDGKDIVKIEFKGITPTAIKIKCTETGGADSVTVSAWVSVQ